MWNLVWPKIYIYYQSYVGTEDLHLPDNNYEHHAFAILENNEVIGYIYYRLNWAAKVTYNFGIILIYLPNILTVWSAVNLGFFKQSGVV